MCWISCRETSEPSEIPSSTSTVWVRIGGTASGRPAMRGDADRDHRAGNQPARQVCPQKQQAAGAADGERFERVEDLGAAGNGGCHRCGDQGHAALWQIRTARTNAPRDCSNAPQPTADGRSPLPRQGRITEIAVAQLRLVGRGLLAFANGISCVPCRAVPWRRLPSSIRARPAVRGLAAFFSAGALVSALRSLSVLAGAAVCAKRRPSAATKRARLRRQGKKSSSWGHLELKRRPQRLRRNAEPRMNDSDARCTPQYFERTIGSRVVASSGCARIRPADNCPKQMTAKETKDDHSSKTIVCNCGVGLCRVCGDLAGAGADHAGMQREIPGRQDRRHARRPEVE